ncbi:MAG TPA: type IX secretion system outer membrane channel protein PorV [Chitinophagaceae bacterium]|nr:type IX secretion system outer membrane channel protein PorV [Chitinophagaceae bacterium]
MNQIIIKKLSFITVFCISATIAAAQTTDPVNIVTTAVPFLRISPDARSGGMGDCGIAASPDANAGFWDLAKTPFAKSNGAIGVTYTPWLKDIAQDVYMATMGGYYKFAEDQAISGSIRYFNLGQIQFVDYSGNLQGNGRPREFSVDFGYSRKITSTLGIGVALRYINSSLANGAVSSYGIYKAGTTVAADLSIFHNGTNDEGEGLNWGITLTNLGGKIGYTDDAKSKDFIPANLGAGIAYTWVFDETSKFTLGLDVNKLLVPSAPVATGDYSTDSLNLVNYHSSSVFQSWFKSFNNDALNASLGGEFNYNDQFFARAGYFYEPKDQGNRKFFTAGVGVKYNVITLNFSYLAASGNGITRNPLSNTLRFGILFDLDSSNSDNSSGQ